MICRSGKLVRWVTLITGLLVGASAGATRHALLIGVGNYDNPVSALLAPPLDVSAVEQTLIEQWGFSSDNIYKLLDGDATRDAIIGALRQLQVVSEEGDFVFVYYAGHGTSALDVNVAAALPHTSGALIPADFDKSGSPEKVAASLVVGRRDIRPILEQLDAGGRQVFFAVDACYSGNTVRGAGQQYTGRPPLVVRAADLLPGDGPAVKSASPAVSEPYPYRQVFYLSAAGEHEPAGEISEELLPWYPTFDGQPHGAFTDALLRAMRGLTPGTDSNGDGNITYLELFNSVRSFMDQRGYQQSPQFLPTMDEAQVDLTRAIIFDAPGAIESLGKVVETRPVTLRMINPSDRDLQELGRLENLSQVETGADMVLVRDQQGVTLLNAAGDIILADGDRDSVALWQRIRGEIWLRLLAGLDSGEGGGSMALQFSDDAMGATAVRGDEIGFSVQVDQPAHLLIFDLDARGGVSVLYPYDESENRRVQARRLVTIDDILVVPPFGVDKLVAVAYRRPLDGMSRFLGQTLEPGSEDLERFKQMLGARADMLAMTEVQLITTDTVNRAARGAPVSMQGSQPQ